MEPRPILDPKLRCARFRHLGRSCRNGGRSGGTPVPQLNASGHHVFASRRIVAASQFPPKNCTTEGWLQACDSKPILGVAPFGPPHSSKARCRMLGIGRYTDPATRQIFRFLGSAASAEHSLGTATECPVVA